MHRFLVAASAIAIVAQCGANLFLLRAARQANYPQLTTELRRIVPPGAPVYGTITFWLALREHPFISYERTEPLTAANTFGAQYFITGDRMMAQVDDSRKDDTFYSELNRQLAIIAARSSVAGHMDDPYYGDLTIYQLNR